MLKKYIDKNVYFADLIYINGKTGEYFQGCTYQDEIKHPIREEYYINLSVHDGIILRTIKEKDQRVINDIWLTSNIINELPSDFNWSDQTRPFRLVANAMQVFNHITEQSELGLLLVSLLADFKGQIFNVGNETFIYLAKVDQYKGVDANQLIVAYPDVFLRIDNK